MIQLAPGSENPKLETMSLEVASSPLEQFHFGRNWLKFLGGVLSEPPLSGVGLLDRASSIAEHLTHHFGSNSFEGKTFLDVGCGSGLVSLAAVLLNASRVVSFDFQSAAVDTIRMLRTHAVAKGYLAFGHSWEVLQGSILNLEFTSLLPRADLVYSYGVLMHTGHTHEALRNLAKLVSTDGLILFYVHSAETQTEEERKQWLAFKQDYNSMLPWEQEESALAWGVSELAEHATTCLATSRNFTTIATSFDRFRAVRDCLRKHFSTFALKARGMDFMTDAHDWLGGYPYEWLLTDQTVHFLKHDVQPAMKTLRVAFEGLTGFLLTPEATGKRNYFVDGVLAGQWSGYSLVRLHSHEFLSFQDFEEAFNKHTSNGVPAPGHVSEIYFAGQGGFCYVYFFPPEDGERCGSSGAECISPQSVVLQDMDIIGWSEESVDGLFCRQGGGARFRVFPTAILFSTADDSDPRYNGHTYHLLKARACAGLYDVHTDTCH